MVLEVSDIEHAFGRIPNENFGSLIRRPESSFTREWVSRRVGVAALFVWKDEYEEELVDCLTYLNGSCDAEATEDIVDLATADRSFARRR